MHRASPDNMQRTPSTSWYLFDEASEVPDKVFQTAYGGLTDGEPMFFAWGQPVRNTGEFYRICFGDLACHDGITRRVDGAYLQIHQQSANCAMETRLWSD